MLIVESLFQFIANLVTRCRCEYLPVEAAVWLPSDRHGCAPTAILHAVYRTFGITSSSFEHFWTSSLGGNAPSFREVSSYRAFACFGDNSLHPFFRRGESGKAVLLAADETVSRGARSGGREAMIFNLSGTGDSYLS
ncbi:MAG TPA: hypothetical protein VKU19_29575 [Bryobacteraceae bacterium]|nr:hypothetical protein [Bryobacteraceae bacterium]